MRIAQLSDIHFTEFGWNPFPLCSKRAGAFLNWVFLRKKKFNHKALDTLPELLERLGVDWLFVGGDLTTTSLLKEFRQAKNFFDQIPIPKLFIPGNHDQYTRRAHRKKIFYRLFENLPLFPTSPLCSFSLCKHGVEAHQIHPGLWVVALDTAPATSLFSSNGLFDVSTERHLEEVLSLIPKTERVILLNHFPFFQNEGPRRALLRAEQLRTVVEKHSHISLYLHGHTHRNTIADLQENNLPIILDSGSLVESPHQSWNLIDLNENGCEVQSYSWNPSSWRGSDRVFLSWKDR